MKRIFLSVLSVFACICLPYAQDQGSQVVNITNEDGLSNSSVNCISQSSDGRMWFGTWDGLNMYNGLKFKVFKPNPSDSKTISHNVIREIEEQKPGVLWVATDKGIDRLNVQTSTFDHWFTEIEKYSENEFHFAIDPNGTVFALVDGPGLGCYKFDEKTSDFVHVVTLDSCIDGFFDSHYGLWVLDESGLLVRYTFNSYDQLSSSTTISTSALSAAIDKKGRYCAVYERGGAVSYYDLYDNSLNRVVINNDVRAMSVSADLLLFADGDSLFEFNVRTKTLTKVLEEESILSIYSGSQGVLWVGTDMHGVAKLVDVRNADFVSYPEKGSSIYGNSAIRSFCKMDDGSLLVGTKGSGLYSFARIGDLPSRHFTIKDGLIDNSVYAMSKDDHGVIWIGTEGQGLNYYDGKRLRKLDMGHAGDITAVYSILPWDENTFYVGTASDGLYKLSISNYKVDAFEKISDGIVYSIIKDDNRLIFGTRGRGVWEYEPQTSTLRPMEESLASLDILSMHLDAKKRLWIGSSTGLYSLSQNEDGVQTLTRLSETQNLPNNTIHAILEDRSGCIWVSTNNGIGRIHESDGTFKITSYYTVDGLYGNEFCDGAYLSSSDGHEFLFGNIGGMTAFDPLAITTSTYLPPIVLDSFKINEEEVALGDDMLVLNGDVNYISFSFSPIDYLNGHRCKISYRVDGDNSDWIDIGNTGTIVLNNLARGRHTLYVRCSTADGEWGDPGFILPFKVNAVWYLSTIAILLYAIFIMGILVLLAWSLFRSLRQKASMLSRETAHEAKLKFFTDIAHEFSNSLTLIYGPCVQILSNPNVDSKTKRYASLIENSSERMRTLIQELIDFRKAETGHLSLHCNVVDLRQLSEREMSYFAEMLSERRVSTSIDIADGLSTWKTDQDSLEKMVFNLLSNASKYTPLNGSIMLKMDEDSGKLVISVTNYGVGISKDKMESIFNRFTVLDRFEKDVSRGRRSTSNGIGLAMCNTLAGLLGGSITVDSDGSSFVKFEIVLPEMDEEVETMTAGAGHLSEWHPVPVLEIPESKASESDEEPDTRKGPMMLVVDDEQQIRQFVADLFATEFVIVQAENGKKALEEVRKRRPDIIISDLVMPEMSGVEMLKVLKSNDLTKRIPVILLSSKDTVENQIEGLSEGAGSFLGKPFNPKQLVALVNSTLNRDKAIIEYSNSSLSAIDMFEGKVLKKSTRDLLTSVTDQVYKNLNNESLSLDMIAEQVAVSKMKLYRAIKESLDMTPTQFIRGLRIQHAEKLLRTTNMTVQEIIYACGFSSKAYFYKVFTERFGLTPKEYREGEQKK